MTDDLRLRVAKRLHAIYQDEARRQGDVRHFDDFEKLLPHIQAYDFALADAILPLLETPEVWEVFRDDVILPRTYFDRFMQNRKKWLSYE